MATTIPTLDNGPAADEFTPFDMAFREDPAPFHADLFRRSPDFMTIEGVRSAYVSTYAQVTAVMRDFKNFSSVKPIGLPGMQKFDFFNSLPVMNYSDPPNHTRRRKVVNPAFTPKRTQAIIDEGSRATDELLDKALAKGSFDAMDDFAKPLAIDMLLSRFMGIDNEDHHIFLNYVKTLALLDALELHDPKPQPYLDAWSAGAQYCREQQELARAGECTNLIGVIANSAEGGAIDDDEMMAMMIVLLTGGVSTVAGAIGLALMNLAHNPELASRIRSNPSLALNHLEESLRLDPPVSLVMRFAANDMMVGEQTITAGMPVYVMIGAACHDPAMFPNPYCFDIDRSNSKDHLAFGYGMHTCIGNAITRHLVPMVLRKVVDRTSTLTLSDEAGIEWETMTARSRHLKTLLVTAG
jgi:cytochrome P450